MAVSPYDVGDSYQLTYTLRAADGSLTNATVTLTVTRPDGTLDTPTVTNPSTGVYVGTGACSQAGMWTYRFAATGTVTDASDGEFRVEPLATPDIYATVPEVRAELGDDTSRVDEGALTAAIRAASRWVDSHTGRRFWRDRTATTRTYRPEFPDLVWVDDIASTSGLIIRTDLAGDGSWATTLAASDYQLEPLNADQRGGAYAWWQIVDVSGTGWGWTTGYRRGRAGLQVTAIHGWSQVPDPVRMATVLKAVALFKRRDAPFGVAGFGDMGAVRIQRSDPDVYALLDPYRLPAVA